MSCSRQTTSTTAAAPGLSSTREACSWMDFLYKGYGDRSMGSASGQYAEKVYAGVLGKIIGVYLGRPVEGWPYERIQSRIR